MGVRFDIHTDFDEKSKKAQMVIDSEVLRRCDPLVPYDSGDLKDSGISGTVLGSGVVTYTMPYARKQYYENQGNGKQGLKKQSKHNYKCLRGSYWFERMKANDLDEIKKKASEVFKK